MASPFKDMGEEELDGVDVDMLQSRIIRLGNELDQARRTAFLESCLHWDLPQLMQVASTTMLGQAEMAPIDGRDPPQVDLQSSQHRPPPSAEIARLSCG